MFLHTVTLWVRLFLTPFEGRAVRAAVSPFVNDVPGFAATARQCELSGHAEEDTSVNSLPLTV